MEEKSMFEHYVEMLEADGWDVHIDGEDDDDGYIERWSNAGEDVIVNVRGGCILEDLLDACKCFDVDEHVMLYIGSLGENGVPDSISALVDDARDIRGQMASTVNHLIWVRKHK